MYVCATHADLVHSHLNHDCTPNVSIRHMPGRGGVRPATRITARTLRAIRPGEELLISYVDPSLPAERRRLLLWRDYCFGPCVCARCVAELPEAPHATDDFDAEKASKLARSMPAPEAVEAAALEQELRASLGF